MCKILFSVDTNGLLNDSDIRAEYLRHYSGLDPTLCEPKMNKSLKIRLTSKRHHVPIINYVGDNTGKNKRKPLELKGYINIFTEKGNRVENWKTNKDIKVVANEDISWRGFACDLAPKNNVIVSGLSAIEPEESVETNPVFGIVSDNSWDRKTIKNLYNPLTTLGGIETTTAIPLFGLSAKATNVNNASFEYNVLISVLSQPLTSLDNKDICYPIMRFVFPTTITIKE